MAGIWLVGWALNWANYVTWFSTEWGVIGITFLVGITIVLFFIITECIKISNSITRRILGVIIRGVRYFGAYFIMMALIRFAEVHLTNDGHYDTLIGFFNTTFASLFEKYYGL